MPSHRTLNLTGWLLFIGSALGFLVASWGDPWGMLGSVLFLIACLVFVVPFFVADTDQPPHHEESKDG